MKVLLATLRHRGHVVPGFVLKDALEQRGHQVHWECFKLKDESLGCISVLFDRFQAEAPLQYEILSKLLQRGDFDCLITDPTILPGWGLYENSGIPWAIFGNVPIFYVTKKVPLYIQASLPELEPEIRRSNVLFSGPFVPQGMFPSRKPTWRHARWAKKKIIHVTQGTVATNPKDLLSPARMAVDGSMFLVEKEFDHANHMNLVDVFITNGGYGGVAAAILHGVPIICCGWSEDKPLVGDRVAAAGIGIKLPYPTDHGKLKDAIIRCLYDTKIKLKCKALSEKCKLFSPFQAVDALEKLAFSRYPASAFGS